MDMMMLQQQVQQVLEQTEMGDLSTLLRQGTALPMLYVWIIALAAGLAVAFFGMKLMRVWTALLGAAAGAAIGGGVAWQFTSEWIVVGIIAAVAGILLAVLLEKFYRAGMFLVAFAEGVHIGASILQPRDMVFLVICLAIGFVLALLSIRFAVVLLIFLTAVAGALQAAPAVMGIAGVPYFWAEIAATAAIAIVGIIIQLTLESGKRKKKNLKKAEEIRQNNSTENEVEKARALMENLDSEEEDEEETKEDE